MIPSNIFLISNNFFTFCLFFFTKLEIPVEARSDPQRNSADNAKAYPTKEIDGEKSSTDHEDTMDVEKNLGKNNPKNRRAANSKLNKSIESNKTVMVLKNGNLLHKKKTTFMTSNTCAFDSVAQVFCTLTMLSSSKLDFSSIIEANDRFESC